MKPREYKAAKKTLGWSHEKIGEILGVTGRTPYRYQSGEVDVPGPSAKLLRVLVLLKLTVSQRKFEEIIEALI